MRVTIAPDFSGSVHCLDADTGGLYWRHDLRAQSYSSPLIVEGKAYVWDGDGGVHFFGLSKEKKLLTERVRKRNLQARVRIEHEDIFTIDLSGADVIAVYLPSPLLQRLIPQLEKLKPGARVVSHEFELPGFKAEKIIAVNSSEDGATTGYFSGPRR
jgi:hypothetical protein